MLGNRYSNNYVLVSIAVTIFAFFLICIFDIYFHGLARIPVDTLDTFSYESWSISRTIGYPAVISFFKYLSVFEYLPWIQLVFFALSSACLCGAIAFSLSQSGHAGIGLAAGLALGLGVAVNVHFLHHAQRIAPDSLFSSLVMLHAAAASMAITTRIRGWVFCAGLCLLLLWLDQLAMH